MVRRRFIFFDVGNTLLFPNRPKMLAPIAAEEHLSLEAWQALERRTKDEFDRGLINGKIDHGFWWTFHTHLLHQLDAFDAGVRDKDLWKIYGRSHPSAIGTELAAHRIAEEVQKLHIPTR